MDETTRTHVAAWLDGQYDAATKNEIRELQERNPTELIDAFYKTLEFGTGGMRGLMGVGTNRLNIYTVRMAAQALANYIAKQSGSGHRVVIGYDCRHHSKLFAEEAARVLSANSIHPHLFSALRPCPLVSFACRHLKCIAGIMITASHNPPQYNGFKVYWSDGAQVLAPHDKGIFDAYRALKCPSQIKYAESPQITYLGDEIDNAYLDATASLALTPNENHQYGSELSVVYSSLHGTGIALVPKILERWGFTNLHIVEEQSIPDGNFPTVKSPNPEDPRAMEQGIALMKELHADIFVATDPDADRVGIAVLHDRQAVLLNGNQIACL
jgi:phosphoglucomutase/phosphomannomutase